VTEVRQGLPEVRPDLFLVYKTNIFIKLLKLMSAGIAFGLAHDHFLPIPFHHASIYSAVLLL
jgi:hypothetical protein